MANAAPPTPRLTLLVAMQAEAAPLIERLGLQPAAAPWPAWAPCRWWCGETHGVAMELVTAGHDVRHDCDWIGTEPATLLPESGVRTLGTFRTAGSDCTGSTMPDSRVEVLVVRRATFDWLLGGGTVPVTGDNTSRYEGPRTS